MINALSDRFQNEEIYYETEQMYDAFKNAGQNVKLILHQNGHMYPFGTMIRDELFDELMNKWLCHYLYEVDNGIEDMPEMMVQSNVDGSYETYNTYPVTKTMTLRPETDEAETVIRSDNFENFYENYVDSKKVIDSYYLEQDEEHVKIFDLKPQNEEPLTFIGSPEVKISTL